MWKLCVFRCRVICFVSQMRTWAVNTGQINITPSVALVGFWAVVSHTQRLCPSTSLNVASRYNSCLFCVELNISNNSMKMHQCFMSSRLTQSSTSPFIMASLSLWEKMVSGGWAKGGHQHSLGIPCKDFASLVSMKFLRLRTMTCLVR